MDLVYLGKEDPRYPPTLKIHLGAQAPKIFSVLGNLDLLQSKKLALFCSVKCPGNLILQTYDLVCSLRDAGTPVIGGFHSPMEKECLDILLRGKQPVLLALARSAEKIRIPALWKKPLDEGRLLLLSPFDKKQSRITAESALIRNRFVAALADAVFIAHAAPGGKMETLCRDILSRGKPLFTLQSEENAGLTALGAKPVRPDNALPLFHIPMSS